MQVGRLEGTSVGPVVRSLWAELTSYLDQVVQGFSQLNLNMMLEIPTPLWAPVPVLNNCLEYFYLSLVRISCGATCDYCSFFFRCAFLRNARLHLPYSYVFNSWSKKLDPQLAFSSSGWTYLVSSAFSSSASFCFHS